MKTKLLEKENLLQIREFAFQVQPSSFPSLIGLRILSQSVCMSLSLSLRLNSETIFTFSPASSGLEGSFSICRTIVHDVP